MKPCDGGVFGALNLLSKKEQRAPSQSRGAGPEKQHAPHQHSEKRHIHRVATLTANAMPASSCEITFYLDGQPRRAPAGCTLAALVHALGHAPEGIATALNAQFVPRQQRDSVQIQPGDQVMLFQPIVGG